MADGEAPTSGEPEEKGVIYPCASKSDPRQIPKEDQRCFNIQKVAVLSSLSAATKAVCHIEVERFQNGKLTKVHGGGTCFLGEIKSKPHDQKIYGLFTAYHVLGEEEIRHRGEHVFTISNRGLPLDQMSPIPHFEIPQDAFCFTCPLLDVTFIEFNPKTIEAFTKCGLDFIQVDSVWDGAKGDELRVLQYPLGSDTQYFCPGHMEGYQGLHMRHAVSTDSGSSGGPVMIATAGNFEVVGIHTARSESDTQNYNIAAPTKSVLKVLQPARQANEEAKGKQNTFHDPVSRHPDKTHLQSLEEGLKRLGLELQRSPRKEGRNGNPRIPYYFKHEGLAVHGVDEKVPMYFVLTSHGWYWSAIAPHNGAEEPNWASANTKVFGLGSYYTRRTVVEDPNGFTFAKLQSIKIELSHLFDNLLNFASKTGKDSTNIA